MRPLTAQLPRALPPGDSLAEKVRTLSALSEPSVENNLNRLAYSHLELLVRLDSNEKRDFYENECLRAG